uniref:Uncharacterized protein n=1 Tax=Ditylenchus dipsaci TaxID=166011 RepID=A0A915D294_9BILA
MVACRQFTFLMVSIFGALLLGSMMVQDSEAQYLGYGYGAWPYYSSLYGAWPYSSYYSGYGLGLGLWGKRSAGFGPSESDSSVVGTNNVLDAAQGPHSLLDGLKNH